MRNITDEKVKSSKNKVEKMFSEKSNVVIAPVNSDNYEQFIAPNLNNNIWDFRIERLDENYNNQNLIEKINEYQSEVILTAWSTEPLPEDIFKKAPTLKYVAHICGSVNKFIPRKLIEQGLLVTNWGNSISRTVGEHCLLQVLACLRKAAKWQIGMHINKEWKPSSYMVCTLFDKTVGVHGFGSCAREFVKLIKPFNCKVRAYSPHVPDKLFNDYEIERADTLEDLFSQNEIVVDLAALTPETKGIVTEKLLKLIPEGGVFVNTGRGAVVDEEALSKVAKNKDIQIALDVFKEEPLPEDSPLRGCENIFLTPHIGGPTIDERKVCGLHALKNVEAFYEDKPLSSVIDLKSYDRMT